MNQTATASWLANVASSSPSLSLSTLMTSPESQVLQRWAKAFVRLRELQQLRDDWDGLGAEAPSPELIESAESFLVAFREQSWEFAPDRIVASPTGTIVIEWQPGHVTLEAEIERPGEVTYTFEEPGHPALVTEDFFGAADWDEPWQTTKRRESAAA